MRPALSIGLQRSSDRAAFPDSSLCRPHAMCGHRTNTALRSTICGRRHGGSRPLQPPARRFECWFSRSRSVAATGDDPPAMDLRIVARKSTSTSHSIGCLEAIVRRATYGSNTSLIAVRQRPPTDRLLLNRKAKAKGRLRRDVRGAGTGHPTASIRNRPARAFRLLSRACGRFCDERDRSQTHPPVDGHTTAGSFQASGPLQRR